MTTVVSALFFYKEELAEEFMAVLMPQLVLSARDTGSKVKLVITLNFPFTPDLWDRLAQSAAAHRDEGVEFELIKRGFNLGFGRSHNIVFQEHPSDIFVAINNDLFCERADWLTAMIRRLGPEGDLDLAGADESRMTLRAEDACGIPAPHSAEFDYLEGSLLGFRSPAAHRLGLFSDDFCYFYFEDSDLGLRYRQAGARIGSIPLPRRHLSAGSAQVPRFVVRNIMDLNRAAFFSKWSRFLQRRSFTARCHANLGALTFAACIEALPALLALTRDYPGAEIDLALPDAAPRDLFLHARWRVCPADFKADPEHYDRVWLARTIQPYDALPPVLAHLRNLGSGYPGDDPRAHLEQTAGHLPPPAFKTDQGMKVALIVATPAPNRQGVAPSPEFYRPAAECLRARGYSVVWAVSGAPPRLDSPDAAVTLMNEGSALLRTIQQADLVVAAAGPGLTLAQLIGRKAFALCGSVLADRAIWAWETTAAYSASELDCLGCQHLWGEPDRSTCLRRDEACIGTRLGAEFAQALDEFLTRGKTSLSTGAMLAAQRLQLKSRRPFFDLDLSRWPEN